MTDGQLEVKSQMTIPFTVKKKRRSVRKKGIAERLINIITGYYECFICCDKAIFSHTSLHWLMRMSFQWKRFKFIACKMNGPFYSGVFLCVWELGRTTVDASVFVSAIFILCKSWFRSACFRKSKAKHRLRRACPQFSSCAVKKINMDLWSELKILSTRNGTTWAVFERN